MMTAVIQDLVAYIHISCTCASSCLHPSGALYEADDLPRSSI